VASIRPKHEAVTVVPAVIPPTRTFSSPSSSETDNPPPEDTFKLRWRSPHCRSTRLRLLRPNDLKLYPSQNLPLTPPVTPLADTRVNEVSSLPYPITESIVVMLPSSVAYSSSLPPLPFFPTHPTILED
jgi:uncharacterized protein YbaR (Trm112 family)